MEDEYKKAQEDQIKAYEKLRKIADSQEFKDFFDFQLKTVADKLIWAFTSHVEKDGDVKRSVDNINNWDEFCKVRGEIVARLHPIQEVNGAEAMKKYLKKQLDDYYKQPV